MKNQLVSILFLLIAISASGQKFEIGINGGLAANNIAKAQTESDVAISRGWQPLLNTSSLSIKAMHTSEHWKYGLSVGYSRFSYKVLQTSFVEYSFTPGVSMDEFFEQIRKYNEQTYGSKSISYIPVKLLVNRRTVLCKRTELYYGASIGYIFVTATQTPQTASFSFKNTGNSGDVVGAQIGATYSISRRLGVNAELNADYMHINSGESDFTVISTPVTLGIRYKL